MQALDFLLAAFALGLVFWSLQSRATRARVGLLARQLQPYEIEKLMQTLSEGYARALDETDAQRREIIWQLLQSSEKRLAEQAARLADDCAQRPADQTQMSTLPLRGLLEPLLQSLPGLGWRAVDLRRLLHLHAQALQRAANSAEGGAARRAHTFLAEMLLLQHSCHWFCRSRTLASARLLAHHQSSYERVLESVHPGTREDYLRLIARA